MANPNALISADSGNYVGVLNRLRVVKDLAPGSDILADIVYIPGAGTVPPTDWSWVNAAARVLAFDHDVGLHTPFSWDGLLGSATILLADLVVLASKRRPIIFICHSCGGLILKQTLWDIGQQPHELKYRYISNVISGLVFLGTPHSKRDNDVRWNRVSWILKSNSNLKTSKGGDPHALTNHIVDKLAKLSKHFEDLDLQVPVLSIYEEIATTVSRRALRRNVQMILIDKLFARAFPNAQNEELVGVKASHHAMGNILNIGFEDRINKFITSVMQRAPGIIEEKFARSEDPFEPEDITLRSYSSPTHSLRDFDVVEDHFTDANSVASTAGSSDQEYEIIPTLANLSIRKREPRLPCYLTTPYERSPLFVGREDVLKMLDDALLPPSSDDSSSGPASSLVRELRSFALCGMGGVGKTSIAIEFVFSRKKKFDAIFFVHADDETKLAAAFCQIAIALGLEDSENAKDQVASRGLVKGFLDNPPKVDGRDARWLIVFDNADDPSLLNEFWPERANGSVLVTSRDPLAMQSTHFANSGIHLNPLDVDHASDLLKKLTGSTAAKGSAEEGAALGLATRLGGLPLAITHIAGSVNQRQLSLSECLEKYQEDENIRELHERELGRLGRKPEPRESLETVWALDALSPSAGALLRVLSLMDPDRIDELILAGSSNSVDIKMREYPQTVRAFETARLELIRSSLVKRNKETKELWIHRVLQDAARARMPAPVLEAAFESLVALLSAAWPFVDFENRHSRGRWPTCQKIFPHVLRLKTFYEKSVAPTKTFQPSTSFAALLNEAGWYHHERGCSQDAKPFLSLAQLICMPSSSSPAVRPLLSDIHYGQGAIATETNDPSTCLTHYSAQLRMQQDAFEQTGQYTSRLGVAFNEMGNAYMMNRHYHDAVNMYKEAITVYRSVGNFNPLMLSLPLVNLGLAYWLTGNLVEAERVLLEALRERERALGVDDKDSFKTGRILHALGNVRASQKRLDESFELHKRALEQYKSTIGPYHHRTADLCHKVAEHHVRLDEHATAQILLDQALKIYGGRPYYKPEIARSNFKKYLSLVAMGKIPEAQQASDEALKLYWEIVGKDQGKSREQLVDADFDDLVVFWTK